MATLRRSQNRPLGWPPNCGKPFESILILWRSIASHPRMSDIQIFAIGLWDCFMCIRKGITLADVRNPCYTSLTLQLHHPSIHHQHNVLSSGQTTCTATGARARCDCVTHEQANHHSNHCDDLSRSKCMRRLSRDGWENAKRDIPQHSRHLRWTTRRYADQCHDPQQCPSLRPRRW
jgi:hypothetical protein